MFRTMRSSVLLAGVLLVAAVCGVCLAETVNINPHKIVLNAQGAADDVQANVHIVLPYAPVVDFDVTLLFDGKKVAEAESAFYCVIDDILIIGFDRESLQDNQDVQDMANKTVPATVDGYVTVEYADGVQKKIHFISSGEGDIVEIVKPGKKGS